MNALTLFSSFLLTSALGTWPLQDAALPAGHSPADASETTWASSATNVLRVYDLSPFVQERRIRISPLRLVPSSLVQPDERGDSSEETLRLDQLNELLYLSCQEDFELEGTYVSLDESGKLIVRAPQATHDRLQGLLTFLSETFGRRVEFRVDVVRLPAGVQVPSSEVGSLDAAGLGRLRQRIADSNSKVETFHVQVPQGEEVSYERTQRRDLIAGFEAEVAQQAGAFDPVVMELTTGSKLTLSSAPAGSGTSVFVALSSSELCDPVREFELGMKSLLSTERSSEFISGPEELQLASVSQRTFAFESYAPTGGGIAIQSTLDLPEAQGTELVILQPLGEGLKSVYSYDDRFCAIDTSAIAPTDHTLGGELQWRSLDHWNLSQLEWQWEGALVLERSGTSKDLLLDTLYNTFADVDIQEAQPWVLARFHRYESDEDAAEAPDGGEVEALVESLTPDVETVTARFTLRRTGDEGSKQVSCELPLRLGKQAVLSLGVEGLRVSDYNVEIAQNSALCVPITRQYIDGLVLTVTAGRFPSGEVSLSLRGVGHLLAERGFFSSGSPMFGDVDQLTFDQLLLDQTVLLQGGSQSVTIGDTSEKPAEGSMRLDIELR